MGDDDPRLRRRWLHDLSPVAEGHRDSGGLKKGGDDATPAPLSSAVAMAMEPRRASSVRGREVPGDDAVVFQVGVAAKLHFPNSIDRFDRHAVLVAIVEVLGLRDPAYAVPIACAPQMGDALRAAGLTRPADD